MPVSATPTNEDLAASPAPTAARRGRGRLLIFLLLWLLLLPQTSYGCRIGLLARLPLAVAARVHLHHIAIHRQSSSPPRVCGDWPGVQHCRQRCKGVSTKLNETIAVVDGRRYFETTAAAPPVIVPIIGIAASARCRVVSYPHHIRQLDGQTLAVVVVVETTPAAA
jgi:hypothetical protein